MAQKKEFFNQDKDKELFCFEMLKWGHLFTFIMQMLTFILHDCECYNTT